MNDLLELEMKLATLKGWTDVSVFGRNSDYAEGVPPGKSAETFGKAFVPAWTRDDQACFQLLSQHVINIDVRVSSVRVMCPGEEIHQDVYVRKTCKYLDKSDALRKAVVEALIMRLEQDAKKPALS